MSRTIARRSFLSTLLALFVAPSSSRAQQAPGKVYRIGYLVPGLPNAFPSLGQAFMQGLQERGYVEGQNVEVDRRYAGDQAERFSALAAELVKAGVDVIVTTNVPSTQAAASATRTIPIVFIALALPVELGIVPNLARPGGNITGLSWDVAAETLGKQLELLKQVNPEARTIAAFRNPANLGPQAMTTYTKALEAGAKGLGVRLRLVDVSRPEDVDRALDLLARERPDGLLIGANAASIQRRKEIVAFSVQHRVPTVHNSRVFVDDGALLSYGPNMAAIYRRAALYVDKILKGSRPGDLPVEQPTKFDLVVNLRTAKTVGWTIPQSIIARADDVIP